jgi:O-antigen ligase
MNRPKTSQTNAKLFIALLALVVWAPLALGSNRPWAWAILEMGAFSILALWLAGHWNRPLNFPPAVKHVKAPLLLLCVWLAYTLFQAIPLPVEVVKILSPASFELHSYASGSVPSGLMSISVDRGATMAEFLKYCLYVTMFFLVLVFVDSHRRMRLLVKLIMFVGLAEGVYGLLNTLTGIEYIWWSPKEYYRGFVTGTFINRNHLAGHLEIVIPLTLGLLMAGQGRARYYSSFKVKLRDFFSFVLEGEGRIAVYLLIMFAALFLTGSRGGVAAMFAALLIVFLIAIIVKGRSSGEARFAPFILVMALLASLWLGLGSLPDRYEETGGDIGARVNVWKPALELSGNYPVFGSGAGTFKYIFPMHEDGSLYGYYDHAHNDYLELLTDQGVIGFMLLGAAIAMLMIKILMGFVKRRDPLMRSMLFASLVGSVSLLLHALVDFNFQIPANAAYFYVILAIGVIASSLKRQQ